MNTVTKKWDENRRDIWHWYNIKKNGFLAIYNRGDRRLFANETRDHQSTLYISPFETDSKSPSCPCWPASAKFSSAAYIIGFSRSPPHIVHRCPVRPSEIGIRTAKADSLQPVPHVTVEYAEETSAANPSTRYQTRTDD